jgi:chemotaxis signal transduction protein
VRALLVPVGADWHAIEMRLVREVVGPPLVTPLPTAPGTLIGVFNLRGEIVPLFDTAALLGLRPSGPGRFVAVVETAVGLAGLGATGVPESVTLEQEVEATDAGGTTAAFAVGTRIATLLDVDELLAPARIGAWA